VVRSSVIFYCEFTAEWKNFENLSIYSSTVWIRELCLLFWLTECTSYWSWHPGIEILFKYYFFYSISQNYLNTARVLFVATLQIYNKPGWCQLFSYATYVTSFLSVWFVVGFSFERYLMIRFPLKRYVLCRPRRARLVVLGITGLALFLYNFALWTSVVEPFSTAGRQTHVCQVRGHTYTWAHAILRGVWEKIAEMGPNWKSSEISSAFPCIWGMLRGYRSEYLSLKSQMYDPWFLGVG